MAVSWMTYWLWGSQKFDGYFAEFRQVKKLIVPLVFTKLPKEKLDA